MQFVLISCHAIFQTRMLFCIPYQKFNREPQTQIAGNRFNRLYMLFDDFQVMIDQCFASCFEFFG